MEQYLVSARKYRPQTFDTVVDQDNIVTTLKNAITRQQLAHAYLFCGPRGVGKTTCARIFAKTINCLNPSENMEACGECESCLSFAEGRSYCIHELDAASNNSVDDIRDLIDKVRIPPQIGRYSVYIIDEVHMLSQAAFNAFLKTLEEPPAYAIFILATTEKHKVLPTILSRCQSFDFNRISIRGMVDYLGKVAQNEGVTIGTDALHVIALRADGAMRDALTLLDRCIAVCGNQIEYAQVLSNLNVLDYDYYFRLIQMALDGQFDQMLALFDEILTKGFNALHFIGGLSSHLRDLLVCKQPASLPLLEFGENIAAKYRNQANSCSPAFLIKGLQICTQAEVAYKTSSNPRLNIELALIKLSQINVAVPGIRQAAALPTPASATAQTSEQAPDPTAVSTRDAAATPVRTRSASPAPKADFEGQKKSNILPIGAPEPTKSISIKDLLKSRSAIDTTPKKDGDNSVQKLLTPFTQEQLEFAWAGLVKTKSAQPRLSSALGAEKPQLTEPWKVLFYVSNVLQKNWMEANCMDDIRNYLRKQLKNDDVVLSFAVRETPPEKKTLYMPTEKARFEFQEYPEVKLLQEDLNLDLS